MDLSRVLIGLAAVGLGLAGCGGVGATGGRSLPTVAATAETVIGVSMPPTSVPISPAIWSSILTVAVELLRFPV